MVKVGSVLNVFCVLEVLLSINTWGWNMFGLQQYPAWAMNDGFCNDTSLYEW